MKKIVSLLAVMTLGIGLVSCDTTSSTTPSTTQTPPISSTNTSSSTSDSSDSTDTPISSSSPSTSDSSSSSSSSSSTEEEYPDELKTFESFLDAAYNSLTLPITELTYKLEGTYSSNTTKMKFATNQFLEETYNENGEKTASTYQSILEDVYYEINLNETDAIVSARRNKIVDEIDYTSPFAGEQTTIEIAQSYINPSLINKMYELAGLLDPNDNTGLINSTYEVFEDDNGYIVLAKAYSNPYGTYTYWDVSANLDSNLQLTELYATRYTSISADNWDEDKKEPIDTANLSRFTNTLSDIIYSPLKEEEPFVENIDACFTTEISSLTLLYSTLDQSTWQYEYHDEPQVGDSIEIDMWDNPIVTKPDDALDKDTIQILSSSNPSVVNQEENMMGQSSWTAVGEGDTTLTIGNYFNQNLYTIDLTVVASSDVPTSNGYIICDEMGSPEININVSFSTNFKRAIF